MENEENKKPANGEPDNEIILHYEELGGLDLRVEIEPRHIASFLLKESIIHKTPEQLAKSKDPEARAIASAALLIVEAFDSRLDIRQSLGWYPIVEDCEKFYKFMKDLFAKQANDAYIARKFGGE